VGLNPKDAFSVEDGIAFDDIVGISGGTVTPEAAEAASTSPVSDGWLYVKTPSGVYQRQNGVWVSLFGGTGGGSCSAVEAALAQHLADSNNPHGLTPQVLGADVAGAAQAVSDALSLHLSNSNPHGSAPQKVAYLYDQRPAGDDGSDVDYATWNPRTVNLKKDPWGVITILGDDFILEAGTYTIDAVAAGTGRLRLYNTSTSTTLLVGVEGKTCMSLKGMFTTTITDGLEIQHWPTEAESKNKHKHKNKHDDTPTGEAFDDNDVEVYMSVEVRRVS